MTTTIRPGMLVTAHARGTAVGRVLEHHPSLPAWIVHFPQDRKYLLAWMDETLTELPHAPRVRVYRTAGLN